MNQNPRFSIQRHFLHHFFRNCCCYHYPNRLKNQIRYSLLWSQKLYLFPHYFQYSFLRHLLSRYYLNRYYLSRCFLNRYYQSRCYQNCHCYWNHQNHLTCRHLFSSFQSWKLLFSCFLCFYHDQYWKRNRNRNCYYWNWNCYYWKMIFRRLARFLLIFRHYPSRYCHQRQNRSCLKKRYHQQDHRWLSVSFGNFFFHSLLSKPILP
mmetsp:Transcript_28581/g.43195  ORF Transcript_28581/g.43195 Transcript_28581/m.43195 type:complete len:206 (+) Transcript_28581:1144-1761(+)